MPNFFGYFFGYFALFCLTPYLLLLAHTTV